MIMTSTVTLTGPGPPPGCAQESPRMSQTFVAMHLFTNPLFHFIFLFAGKALWLKVILGSWLGVEV